MSWLDRVRMSKGVREPSNKEVGDFWTQDLQVGMCLEGSRTGLSAWIELTCDLIRPRIIDFCCYNTSRLEPIYKILNWTIKSYLFDKKLYRSIIGYIQRFWTATSGNIRVSARFQIRNTSFPFSEQPKFLSYQTFIC